MAVTALPAGEAFVKQRRFKFAVALEVADRGGEDFTAGNTAAGGGEVGLATAGGGAVGGAGGGVVFCMASKQALIKTFRMRSSRSASKL